MSTEAALPLVAEQVDARPILKWAGGKTQLLEELTLQMPKSFGRYIEPFFGGGALFFHLEPAEAIIADSNPELINLYRAVADCVDDVVDALAAYENSEDSFYAARSVKWENLEPAEAAARTIFLNRTCFNGLYRVNRSGQFNVPYGHYASPRILDDANLRAASRVLSSATIVEGDYKQVLLDNAEAGDFVFLDPPYLPVSSYSDFKRYTKEQFYEDDHRELADEIERLHALGCHVLLTNSNHPLVHEMFGRYEMEVVNTRRNISSKASKRAGEDVIVNIPPKPRLDLKLAPPLLPDQVAKFPSTRFMGSKAKLLSNIWAVASQFEYEQAVDLFSGSGTVGYMFKAQGKAVRSNDYMAMSAVFAKAMIENRGILLSEQEALELVDGERETDMFVARTFAGLYYTPSEDALIDRIRAGIPGLKSPYKRAIAMSALIRASLKKRPRGIFTYVGAKYNDGRRDLQLSFRDQFLDAVRAVNEAVFDNGQVNRARHGDAMSMSPVRDSLVYIDPPYYSPLSDNEYVRRYHFVEGLARDWQGVEIQDHTVTKKFKSYPTPFSSRKGAEDAFDALFRRFKSNVLLVSYSSNSLPAKDEMVSIMSRHKRHVDVIPVDYRYSFGTHGHKVGANRNAVQEYLFVGY